MNKKRTLLLIMTVTAVLAAVFYLNHLRFKPLSNTQSTSDEAVRESSSEANLVSQAKTDRSARNLDTNFTIDGSRDYSELKAYYEPLAKKGDSHALKVIAQIYEYCFQYSLSPVKFESGIDAFSMMKPENKQRLESIKQITKLRCSKLDGGLPITADLIDLSWRQAFSAGDVLAKLRVSTSQELKASEIDQLVLQAIQSREPDALFEAGNLLAQNNNSDEFSNLSGSGINQYAWQIVACRARGNSMCLAGSNLMNGYCVGAGACNYSSFEDLVRRGFVGSAELAALDRAITELEIKLKNRGY